MKHTIEELYGCSRAEYCRLTGITANSLVLHLKSEIIVLKANYERLSGIYRNGESVATDEQRRIEKLLADIHNKIISKTEKVDDITVEFNLP